MRTHLFAFAVLLSCVACGAPQPAPDADVAEESPGASAPTADAPSTPTTAPASRADAPSAGAAESASASGTPPASASADARATWCERYVPSVVAAASADLPPDVRPTHLMEVEFNSCTLDPQEYARQTAAERRR